MSTSQIEKEIQRRVVRALDDGEVMDFGTVKAQRNSRALYGAIPKRVAIEENIEQSDELSVSYHRETGSIILTPTQ